MPLRRSGRTWRSRTRLRLPTVRLLLCRAAQDVLTSPIYSPSISCCRQERVHQTEVKHEQRITSTRPRRIWPSQADGQPLVVRDKKYLTWAQRLWFSPISR